MLIEANAANSTYAVMINCDDLIRKKMRLLRKMITVTSVFLLVGCASLLPTTEQITAPTTTRAGIPISAHQTPSPEWWKKMHDPVLNHLICEALRKNNQLQNSKANVLAARAQLQEARFAWLPTVNASARGFVGGGWDTHFNLDGPFPGSNALNKRGGLHFRGYFAGFVPKYSLNIMDNIYQTSYAKASFAMQKAMYQSTRISIISQISGAYFMLLGQREQLEDQKRYLQDLKQLRKLEHSRYRHGATDLTVITDLDRQIESYTTNLDALENSNAQLENSIQILLDRNPGPLSQYGDIMRLPVKGLIPTNVPSEVLKNRPDIMTAEENLNMSGAKIGVAYAKFFPSISLTDLTGASSVDLNSLLKLATGLWVLQGAASIPLLNGVSYAQIKEAKAGYLASYYNYIQTLRSAFADVDNSLTNQQKMYSIYDSQAKAFYSAKKSYTLSMARYKAGLRDYRDVVNSKLVVDSAKLNMTVAKAQQLDSIVGVYQALAYCDACVCHKCRFLKRRIKHLPYRICSQHYPAKTVCYPNNPPACNSVIKFGSMF